MPRPRKTPDSLPDGWQKAFIELAEQGASEVEMRAWVYMNGGEIGDKVWKRWKDQDEGFRRTILICKILCQAWWEKEARTNLKSTVFQTGAWYANMKNRFGWRDKQETEHKAADSVQFVFEKVFGGNPVEIG